MSPALWLASRSPRRRELLAQLGITPRILEVDVPEVPGVDESPADYVARVARAKAEAGLAQLGASGDLVLAADTEVVLAGKVMGKPRDAADAQDMLAALSGCQHQVHSVVVVLGSGEPLVDGCVSRVRMAELSQREIEAYVASGEPFGKAGGYAIQGRAAAFIAHLDGSYSGVMGLPLYQTAGLLARAGYPLAAWESSTRQP